MLKQLVLNFESPAILFTRIFVGECVKCIEDLGIVMDESCFNLSIVKFFHLLGRFSNLKSLSVTVVSSNKFSDSSTPLSCPKLTSTFRDLLRFQLVLKNCQELTNFNLNDIIQLMPRLIVFNLKIKSTKYFENLFSLKVYFDQIFFIQS